MSSNIRAKSIEGHVTDSAGNVLRSAQIIIKQVTPAGSYPVDTVNSDDSGYFITKPIPNGIYDIYESGIRVSRTIHKADENSIQCYKAHRDNYNTSNIQSFDYLVEQVEMNDFMGFIQIESSEVDVQQYGSSFPIYDFEFASSDPQLSGPGNDLWHLSKFFNFSSDSRITTTRFDIEYFSPLTALSSSYRRIRWSGIPGIRFYQDSKIVAPLDYFSIVLNYPKLISPATTDYGGSEIEAIDAATNTISVTNPIANDNFKTLCTSIVVGDILKIDLVDSTFYYGIVQDISSSGDLYTLTLEESLSSRYDSDANLASTVNVKRIHAYDGMFRGVMDIDEEANERFTVVENTNAQNSQSEIYTYVNRYTT